MIERGVCWVGVWQLLGGSVVGVPGLGGEAEMVGQLMKPGRHSRESFQDPTNPSHSGQQPPPSVTSESSQRLLVVANRLPMVDPRTPPSVVVRGLRLGAALLLGLEIQRRGRWAHRPRVCECR